MSARRRGWSARAARWVPVLALLAAACQTPAPQEAPVPAVIVDADAVSQADLRQAVGTLLGDQDVLVADDALTHSSRLLIERLNAYDQQGERATGRDFGRPEALELRLSGGACTLVRARDGRSAVLAHTHCQALQR